MDITPYYECIHQAHPVTIEHIIKNESSFRPFAINVNRLPNQPPPKINQPKSKQEAIEMASYYLSLGHSVDLGLMQINTANLKAYNVTIEDMFEPCQNIHVGSRILHEGYQRALKINSEPSQALQIALSYYNTGSPTRGFSNGYVARYHATPRELSLQALPEAVRSAPSTISTQSLYR